VILFPLSPNTSFPHFSLVFPFILIFNYISYASLSLPLQTPNHVSKVSRQSLTAEVRVGSLANPHRFFINKSGTWTDSFLALPVFPYEYHFINAPHSSSS
jgi:hypothetical protein